MALLEEAGRDVPVSVSDADEDAAKPVDHLADIERVMRGEVRVRTQIVLRRLDELNPDEYGDWSFQDLAVALAEAGVAARKSDGKMVVRAVDLARALAERDDELEDADD